MGLQFLEKFEFVLEDDSYIAVRQDGRVEVWTVNGKEWIGNLPEKATADDVDAVLRVYSRALDRGFEEGRVGLAEQIRHMLEMD